MVPGFSSPGWRPLSSPRLEVGHNPLTGSSKFRVSVTSRRRSLLHDAISVDQSYFDNINSRPTLRDFGEQAKQRRVVRDLIEQQVNSLLAEY